MFPFMTVLKRDLVVAYRHWNELLNPLLFFILVCSLFPLAITSEPTKLMSMASGIIWIALLFSSSLTMENLFQYDFDDGTLEQMALMPSSFSLLICAKLLTHWLITGFPLLIASSILSQLFFLPLHATFVLFLSILLGSPVLTCIGAIGAALTLSLRNRSILLILLIVPLYLPVLIFGSIAATNAVYNLPFLSELSFLAAFLTLALTFSPLIIAATLRISLE